MVPKTKVIALVVFIVYQYFLIPRGLLNHVKYLSKNNKYFDFTVILLIK